MARDTDDAPPPRPTGAAGAQSTLGRGEPAAPRFLPGSRPSPVVAHDDIDFGIDDDDVSALSDDDSVAQAPRFRARYMARPAAAAPPPPPAAAAAAASPRMSVTTSAGTGLPRRSTAENLGPRRPSADMLAAAQADALPRRMTATGMPPGAVHASKQAPSSSSSSSDSESVARVAVGSGAAGVVVNDSIVTFDDFQASLRAKSRANMSAVDIHDLRRTAPAPKLKARVDARKQRVAIRASVAVVVVLLCLVMPIVVWLSVTNGTGTISSASGNYQIGAMRVTSDGSVGIGTTNPGASLEVSTATDRSSSLRVSSQRSSQSEQSVQFGSYSGSSFQFGAAISFQSTTARTDADVLVINATRVSVPGSLSTKALTASSFSTAGSITATNFDLHNQFSTASLSSQTAVVGVLTATNVSVASDAQLQGNVELGTSAATPLYVARAATAATVGGAMFVAAQNSTSGTGGDLFLDAGRGASLHGRVMLGANGARELQVVPNAYLSGTLSVAGLVRTPASLSAAGAITAGQMVLGVRASDASTVALQPRIDGNVVRVLAIQGESSTSAVVRGGDLSLDAGSGTTLANSGTVHVGTGSSQVRIGNAAATVAINGTATMVDVTVTGSLRTLGTTTAAHVVVASLTTAGAVTAAAGLSTAGSVSALGTTLSGSLTATAGATLAGALTGTSATLSSALTAASLSSGGAATAASLTTGGTLGVASSAVFAAAVTATGTTRLIGSVQLGNDAVFTLARAPRSGTARGASTYVFAQSGHVSSNGGDMYIDAGSGGTAGVLRLGTSSSRVVLAAASVTTDVLGPLLAQTVNATSAIGASGFTTSGALTAADVTAATVRASGSSQLAQLSAGGVSVSGTLTAAAATATALTAGSASVAAALTTATLTASSTIGAAGMVTTSHVATATLTASSWANATNVGTTRLLATNAYVVQGIETFTASVSSSLTVGTSATIRGSLVLGDNGVFSLARPVRTTSNKGSSSYILGQAAGQAASAGGDLVLDAGTGATNGAVLFGATARAVAIGGASVTTTFAGTAVAQAVSVTAALHAGSLSSSGAATAASADLGGALTAAGGLSSGAPLSATGATLSGLLTATGASLSGGLTAAHLSTAGAVSGASGTIAALTVSTLSTSGAVTAASVTAVGSLTVGSSAWLVGSVQLGSTGVFSLARPVQASARGASTFIVGQRGASGSNGGNLHIDVGTGSAGNGALLLGVSAAALTIGASGAAATSPSGWTLASLSVTGALVAGSFSTSSALTAASASLSGALTATSGVTLGSSGLTAGLATLSGTLTAASCSISGTVTAATLSAATLLAAPSFSTAGAVTAASMSTAGAVTAASLTATTLDVGNSARLVGTVLLGSNGAFTFARPVRSGAAKGSSTTLLGQQGGTGSAGGDLVIDAGTGTTSGNVKLGGAAATVVIGSASSTTSTLGALSAAAIYTELTTPASMSAPCTVGRMTFDAGAIYVCVATNTWKSVAVA